MAPRHSHPHQAPIGGVLVQRSRPFSPSSSSKRSQARLPGVIQEIDIWRVAMLMVKRYADNAEANADRRADELETEGGKIPLKKLKSPQRA